MNQSDVVEREEQSALRDRLGTMLQQAEAAFANEPPAALDRLGTEAVDLARRLGDERAECLAERVIAVAELRRGEAEAALARVDGILPTVRRLGDQDLLMTLLGTLGTSAELVGKAQCSDEARREVEAIATAVGDRRRLGGSMADRGSFLGLRGETLAGATLIAEAIEVLRPFGNIPDLRWSRLQLAILEARLDQCADARRHMLEALPADFEREDLLMLTNVVGALYELATAEGRIEDAQRMWPTLLTALRTHGIYWQRPGLLARLAESLARLTHASVDELLNTPAVPVGRPDLVAAIRGALD